MYCQSQSVPCWSVVKQVKKSYKLRYIVYLISQSNVDLNWLSTSIECWSQSIVNLNWLSISINCQSQSIVNFNQQFDIYNLVRLKISFWCLLLIELFKKCHTHNISIWPMKGLPWHGTHMPIISKKFLVTCLILGNHQM